MTAPALDRRVVIFGGAGMVGQNLVMQLGERGHQRVLVIDKHRANLSTLRRTFPWAETIEADLAEPGPWEDALASDDLAVMLQAQIGGIEPEAFDRNNGTASERVLSALARREVSYLVHVSSSVVNSMARDWYTESKKAQEKIVDACPVRHCVLRPTLMFGWFDRKHLGWLSRFMERAPAFPIPGSGRYLRQPLFVGDFCRIVLSALATRREGTYDMSGLEKVDYIDLIRAVKRASGARTPIVRIPYAMFWLMLRAYALVRSNPPFTIHQLRALVTPDEFAVEPWDHIFGVAPTAFDDAVRQVFGPSQYRDIVLDF